MKAAPYILIAAMAAWIAVDLAVFHFRDPVHVPDHTRELDSLRRIADRYSAAGAANEHIADSVRDKVLDSLANIPPMDEQVKQEVRAVRNAQTREIENGFMAVPK